VWLDLAVEVCRVGAQGRRAFRTLRQETLLGGTRAPDGGHPRLRDHRWCGDLTDPPSTACELELHLARDTDTEGHPLLLALHGRVEGVEVSYATDRFGARLRYGTSQLELFDARFSITGPILELAPATPR